MITKDQLKALGISEEWYDPLVLTFFEFEISTDLEIAGFIGQCQHESDNFKSLVENLNYSAEGLMKTWPNRFPTRDIALKYAKNPEAIANKVYADRLGNASEASRNGYKYRGRGLIQLTGLNAYKLVSNALNTDLVSAPELLEKPLYAALSAGWFWKSNNLNSYCNKKDWINLTKRINGGTIGLEDRIKRIEKVLSVIQN